MAKNITFSTDIQFVEAEPLESNPMLSKVKIRIARHGKNRNKSTISKEALQRAAEKTLGLTPIVGYYNYYKDDFGEHGMQPVFDDDGNLVNIADTQALGVIPESPTIYWEEDYLVTFGYLWTARYPEIKSATEGRPQSMELSPEHTIVEPLGDGYFEILETAFTGLCILGNDITPCFEKASIEGMAYSYVATDKSKKGEDNGMADLMKNLKFALENNFDEDNLFIVDEEGEEKNKEAREKITEAINTLDEVAETEGSENQDIIDDSITELVNAETELAGEAKIIPANTDIVEELRGEPSREDGIVSTEIATYKSSNSLLRKNKTKEERDEEELADKKKKDEEVVVKAPGQKVAEVKPQEEQVAPVAQPQEAPVAPVAEGEGEAVAAPVGGQPTDPGQVEEVAPIEETTREVAETKGTTPGTDLAVEPTSGIEPQESSENPFADTQEAPLPEGTEVQGATVPEPVLDEEPKRETADDKRKKAVLDSISDEELSDHLIERVEEAEKVKENIAKLAGTDKESVDPQNIPEVGMEEGVETTESETFEEAEEGEMPFEDKTDEEGASEDMVTEETTEEVKDEVVEDEKDTIEGTDKTVAPTDKKEEDVEETEEKDVEPVEEEEEVAPTGEDEDKKKKKNFSFDGEFKAIVLENAELANKVEKLEEEKKELLKYKLQVEKEEKEKLLAEFDISDDAKEDIRTNFSLLGLEEIEQKAALIFFKESKAKRGQKSTEDSIQFSLHSETEEPTSGLETVLARAKKEIEK